MKLTLVYSYFAGEVECKDMVMNEEMETYWQNNDWKWNSVFVGCHSEIVSLAMCTKLKLPLLNLKCQNNSSLHLSIFFRSQNN